MNQFIWRTLIFFILAITVGHWSVLIARGQSSPPVVNAVVNGASFAPGAAVAPGSIASAFGSNFGSSIAGVTFRLNGVIAPLFYVSPTQINFQVPWELAGQPQASVTVDVGGVRSSAVSISLSPYSAGIFFAADSSDQGAILSANTPYLAAPAGAFLGSLPAIPGHFISIFCTGLGPVTNQPDTGTKASDTSQTTVAPTVTIGGTSALVQFSGLAPDFFGLYQVDVQVPDNAPSGNAVPVVLNIGGGISNFVTIAVQNEFSGVRSVDLTWNRSTSDRVVGYNVYRSSTPGEGCQKTPINSSPIRGTAYTDTGLLSGGKYYYGATAVDTGGAKSVCSNEASAVIP